MSSSSSSSKVGGDEPAGQKFVAPFVRPYFDVYRTNPRCAFCARELRPADFCDKCCFRRCRNNECEESQKAMQATFHTQPVCDANEPRLFPEQLLAFLRLGDHPDTAVLDKEAVASMVASMHVHQMRQDYAPKATPEERTTEYLTWRNTTFPRVTAHANEAYLNNLPRLSSNFQTLPSLLFGALFLLHDGSMDALVQLFVPLYYMHQLRLHDLMSVIENKVNTIPSHRRYLLLTNRIVDAKTKLRSPNIELSCTPPLPEFRPLAFIKDVFARPVAKSLVLFEFVALELSECQHAVQKGAPPRILYSMGVLMYATKNTKGECFMRLVQTHRQFYSVGNWLDNKLPSSDVPREATVARSPRSAGLMTDRCDFEFVGNAMDALIYRHSTPEQRRDAYRDLTGITIVDAICVPHFNVSYMEANLTL